MKYPAITAAFYNTPHAITPEKLAEVEAFLARKVRGQDRFDDAQEDGPAAGPARDDYQMVGRIAVVNVMGVLAQRMNLMSAFSGGTSYERLGATIDQLAADRGVRSIVLNVDSPGGSVFGLQEVGDKLRAARDEKKLVAVANAQAASAAYWLASQASELVVTPSGRVGSIGVIAMHTDDSKADEMAGVKTTVITAGKYKGEDWKPLTEESQSAIQREVDAYYGMFVRAVAKGRGVTESRVESEFGQGRMVMAKEAAEKGMADRVGTLEQTLRRLGADADAAKVNAEQVGRRVAADLADHGLPTV